jgi:uncharacterized protein (TIGR02453 family)
VSAVGRRPVRQHFNAAFFRFLEELAANNDRDWFRRNKERYEREVRDPMIQFVLDFGEPLRRISPAFVADPRPVGGSIFRIQRDTRFSRDKRPYKTHAGIRFRHVRSRDVHAPGFYLHLEPGNVFVGAGIWHPDPASQLAVRTAIAADPARWKRILRAKSFRDRLETAGDSLKRPPRGFDPEHPLIGDLMRKDYIVVAALSEREACEPGFLLRTASICRAAAPYVRFVTDALDLEG